MQGNGLIGITLQDLVIDRFCLRQTALVVMLDAKVDGLLDG